MMSRANRPLVNISMGMGSTPGKAVAGLSNGFSVSMTGNTALRVSCIKCGAIVMGTRSAPVRVILGRSDRVVSRMIMINCNSRGGIGIANTMNVIGSRMLRTHPMRGMSRTLRNIMPNLGLSIGGNNNSLSDRVDVGVHNANAVNSNSKSSPLMLVSNVRNDLGAMGPGSVRSMSMLGSTTSTSVCNTHTTFNIILMGAGDKRSKGPEIACSNGIHFSSTAGVPRVLSSCAFTRCFGHTTTGSGNNAIFDGRRLRHVGTCRSNALGSSTAFGRRSHQ